MELEAIISIGIAFGLAFFFTVYTFKSLNSFLIWLMVFISFIVWVGLLPLWVLIFNMLIIVVIMILKYNNRGTSEL